ncbi:MAG: hypothetical protein GAK40_00641 [Burkholderia plantarii]|nr:MAG: hypothetical protein GAK40_00641 [Burkholderia plantarii]
MYYAAAKRFVLHAGATDVLIFEHRISDAISLAIGPASEAAAPAAPLAPFGAREVCALHARLALALIEQHPIRNARFATLPEATAPWWLISEPNAYVFLSLGLAGCLGALPSDTDDDTANDEAQRHDATLRLASDAIGACETRLRDALRARDPADALRREFERIVRHL